MTTPGRVSEMLQQMAAESTGTAAPIHLQGEPMPLAPTPNPDAVPGHGISICTAGHDGMVDSWAECECGWRGTTHRNLASAKGNYGARRDGLAHAEQFKAPAPKLAGTLDVGSISGTFTADPHLQAYTAKRAEWLQAKHDADVASRAAAVARKDYHALRVQADAKGELYGAAAKHAAGCEAASMNLEAELLALVKGEQA